MTARKQSIHQNLFSMISERKNSKKTVSMNGMVFSKQYTIWSVMAVRMKKGNRRYKQSLFDSESTALEYWKTLVNAFEGLHSGEMELKKDIYKEDKYGEIKSAKKSYILNGEDNNRQLFSLRRISVLELAESADLDECTNSIDVSWHDDCEANPDEMLLAS